MSMIGHPRLPPYLAAAAALFLASALAPLAGGDPLGQVCGASGNYTLNDTYQGNIKRLAATLPKNASSSQALFAKASLGAVPDIVYALALCRGDTNASAACGDCVATAFTDAQQVCPYKKDATVFYNLCFLRYSNQNFLDSISGGGNVLFVLMPTRNVTTSGTQYVAVTRVLDNGDPILILKTYTYVTSPFRDFDAAVAVLVNATADYAAADASRRFATAVEAFQTFSNIYGLAQCIPDMTASDCRTCLAGMTQMGSQYFSGRWGAMILGLRCSFRYEQYPFFPAGPLHHQLPEAAVNGPPTTTTRGRGEFGGQRFSACAAASGNRTARVLAIILLIVVMILGTVVVFYCLWRRRKKPAEKTLLIDSINPEDIRSIDSLMVDLPTLRATTENFDEGKKLGEGGFGAVYKGVLPNGREIAVKRLSQSSRQGMEELKTELVLVAKLQHKNLVRLVGACLEEHEKLLVYEYMPNSSLDTFLFDPDKSNELDLDKRFMIINGIAQGLQYLHEESQLKIVHRDLKASNVLLDSDFHPKISDFGLARLFGSDHSQYVTNRVVGTYGYMAPEYAMRGHYSTKSDVFSFGVLMLEIVAGRRNGGSYDSEQHDHLLSLVWGHWTMGTILEIMDSSLSDHPSVDQMFKCIHIGLLCVQHNPADRPVMSAVNTMLNSSSAPRQAPSRPAFCFQKSGTSQCTSRSDVSANEVTITEVEAR